MEGHTITAASQVHVTVHPESPGEPECRTGARMGSQTETGWQLNVGQSTDQLIRKGAVICLCMVVRTGPSCEAVYKHWWQVS
jgi:hypothetical protein